MPRSDVFLSHATADKPVVEELATKLRQKGIEPWLDIWNLIPGDPWQEAIEAALATCASCAVLIGPGGTGPWQNEEMRTAIDRRVSNGKEERFRVIPVLLPNALRGEPSRLPDFLRNATWVEFRESLDDEKALHRLISGIRGVAPGPGPGGSAAEGACPYRGLEFFDVRDFLFFFGREALTGWLLDKLRPGDSANRFLAIVGASGSGKSSLARAGLLAALQRGELPGSEAWPHVILKPGARPLENLAVALAGAAGPGAVSDLIGKLGSDPRMVHLKARVALREAPAGGRLVLLVDQFEEVFTLCSGEEERRSFLDNLLYAATTADGLTAVILTLRADFYARCAAYPDLAAAVADRQILVGPMTRDELQSAIERPAYLAGRELEGGLADLLLNEVEPHPGSLPLLEHALLEIWKRSTGRRLTVNAYREIGGVLGALEKHAEEVYGELSIVEREACRQVFLRLVQVDEQGRATRRRLDQEGLVSAAGADRSPTETVVARLIDERLLTTDQKTVEAAHEALLSGWKRLRDWIEQDRESLQTRHRLGEAVAEWSGKNRDPSYLYRGARLLHAEEWWNAHPGEAGGDAEAFLAAGRAEEEAESRRARERTEEQARTRKKQRNGKIGFAAVVVAALVGGWIAWSQHMESEKGRKNAFANELGGESQIALEQRNPALALLLGIEAVRQAERGGQQHLPGAENSLRKALSFFRGDPLSTGKIRAAGFSFDRRWLGVAGTDGILSLWHLTEKGPIRTAFWEAAISRSADQIAVGPDGRWMLIRSDKKSRLFEVDLGSGKARAVLELDGESWVREPFSPWLREPSSLDGLLLLTVSGTVSPSAGGGRSLSWTVRRLEPSKHVVKLPPTLPVGAAFSPDGRWLAVSDREGTRDSVSVKIIKTSDFGKIPPVLQPIPGGVGVPPIAKLAFSSDSHWLVTAPTYLAWKLPPAHEPLSSSIRFNLKTETPPGFNYRDPSLVSNFPELLLDLNSETFQRPNAGAIDLGTGRVALAYPSGLIQVGHKDFDINWTEASPADFLTWLGQRLVVVYEAEPPRLLEIPLGSSQGKVESGDLGVPIGTGKYSTEKSPSERRINPSILKAILESTQCRHSQYDVSSPNGEWLFTASPVGNCLWNLEAPGSKPRLLTPARRSFEKAAFRSDGRQIGMAGSDGIVYAYELGKNSAPVALPDSPPVGLVTALAFLSDGRLAIGAQDRPVILWRPGQKEITGLSGSSSTSYLVASSKGNRLASRTAAGIEVWISEKGKLPSAPIRLPGSETIGADMRLAFSEDGNQLWAIQETNQPSWFPSTKKLPRRWELQTDKLLDTACRAVGRNLTEREWKTYLPSEKYSGNEPCPIFGKAFD